MPAYGKSSSRKKRRSKSSSLKQSPPVGAATKEKACASCVHRKVRCTGGRPACTLCIKAAVARGYSAEGVRCLYFAASIFAKEGDDQLEAEMGGRDGRCFWGESIPVEQSTSATVSMSTSATMSMGTDEVDVDEQGSSTSSSRSASPSSSSSSNSSASTVPTSPSDPSSSPLVSFPPRRLASSPPPSSPKLTSRATAEPVSAKSTPPPITPPSLSSSSALSSTLVPPLHTPLPSLPPFVRPDAAFWEDGPLKAEEIKGWSGLLYAAR
ncbi:hypothetical protein JCM8547_006762 [Rhodosporidiobolus lusitaniae]